MPVFALGLLALPYLPWLSDWLPALRLLAGPGSRLLWVVVLGQVVWLMAHRRAVTSGRLSSVVSVLVIFFGMPCDVCVHGIARVSPRSGMPWPAIAGAAAVAALTWWWAAVLTRSKPAATFGWASIFLSVPFVLNSGEFLPDGFTDGLVAVRHLPSAKSSGARVGCSGRTFRSGVWHLPVRARSAGGGRRTRGHDARPIGEAAGHRFERCGARIPRPRRQCGPLVERIDHARAPSTFSCYPFSRFPSPGCMREPLLARCFNRGCTFCSWRVWA